MNIETFDLNLLRVLAALLQECNVTRAAERLHLSQPAVSHALNRLREQLHDPILVRVGNQLQPTERAAAWAEPVRIWLAQVQATLTPADFDPAQVERVFRVSMPDYCEFLLAGELLAALARQAPRVRLALLSLGPAVAEQGLESGDLDLAIGYLGEMSASTNFYRQTLFSETFVCMAKQGHPRVQGALSLEAFCAEEHMLVSPQGGGFKGVVDALLQAQGLSRRVRVSLPHFLMAPALVAQSELLVTFAARAAQRFAQQYPLQVLPPPLPIPGFQVSQAWHVRTQHDPVQRWFRQLVLQVAARATA